MRREAGFTIHDFLIVLGLLCVLAGVTVPQYFSARSATRIKALDAGLLAVRTALERYRVDHEGRLPGGIDGRLSEAVLVRQLTTATDVEGTSDVNGVLGPYLAVGVPRNPYNGQSSILVVTSGRVPPPDDTSGWTYHLQSNSFRANTSGTGPDGKLLYTR